MFEESLVESTPLLRTNNRWPALISFAAQAAFVLALIALPILHPDVVQLHAPKLSFITLPPRPIPPPPPPEPIHVVTTTASAPTAPSLPTTAPVITHSLSSTNAFPDAPPNLNPTTIMPGGNPTNPFGSSIVTGPNHAIVAVTGTPARQAGPLHISTGVSAGLLLGPIQPVYPPIARAAHVGGTVVVQAIISKTGHIESAHVVSGPAMLQSAAMEAVRSARYRPFLLNGDPTEVDTTISINFNLGS
jgi:protein TonB